MPSIAVNYPQLHAPTALKVLFLIHLKKLNPCPHTLGGDLVNDGGCFCGILKGGKKK